MFGLRSGVLIFVSIEALFWAIISFAAVYSEVKYIRLIDILEWADELERDWYYYLIFDHPRDLFDDKFRSKWEFRCEIIDRVWVELFLLLIIKKKIILQRT